MAAAIGKLGRYARGTSAFDISAFILGLAAVDQQMAITTPLWENLELALRHVGFAKFRQYWRVGRLLVSLQTRLFVEEVMTFMGSPWDGLKTGFDTISQVGEGKRLSPTEIARRRAADAATARRLRGLKRSKSKRSYRPGGF